MKCEKCGGEMKEVMSKSLKCAECGHVESEEEDEEKEEDKPTPASI